MTSGTTKKRRKLLTRVPLDYELQLTQRDQGILIAVAEYRALTTRQLSTLFFRPSPDHLLRKLGIGKTQALNLMEQYPAAYLNEKVVLLKWLRMLASKDPVAFAALDQSLTDLTIEKQPLQWLLKALQKDLTPPQAFTSWSKTTQRRISSACTHRLRLHFDAGYLERKEQPIKLSEGRKPLIWFLSKKGRTYVAGLLKVAPKELYRLEVATASHSFLPHLLKTNDLRIAITLAAQRLGFEIKEWRDDLTLRRFHSKSSERVTVTYPDGTEQQVGVVPDGYFWLHADKHGHFFVECDLATVVGRYSQRGLKDWERKVLSYKAYYQTRYHESYPEAKKSMRILTVTTGETRLANLVKITGQVAGKGAHRYWFTTFDRITPETVLTENIWLRPDKKGQHRLVT